MKIFLIHPFKKMGKRTFFRISKEDIFLFINGIVLNEKIDNETIPEKLFMFDQNTSSIVPKITQSITQIVDYPDYMRGHFMSFAVIGIDSTKNIS